MQRYVMQFWANVAQLDLYLHEVGYYIFRFQNKEDMQEFFYNGPYTINNKPIILKPWSIDFDLSNEFPTEISLWVKFPNLPMTCWSKDSLSRIASTVGKPVYANECTSKQTRISFARMLIEDNVVDLNLLFQAKELRRDNRLQRRSLRSGSIRESYQQQQLPEYVRMNKLILPLKSHQVKHHNLARV
ncbi:hypothetical protein KY290_011033 [Solanum tuberosum]|uniref:DUF4283 domain-containing protein n=1 Tax=Solanum tuberosum TaxID=4113 RepID=A0ABQ7W0Q6_SOLTU|nr:hypothetical protein KY290_011033 [Solanum tuberosum]